MKMMMTSGAINAFREEKRRVFGVWWWFCFVLFWFCFGVNELCEWGLKGECVKIVILKTNKTSFSYREDEEEDF